jgi:hypothetical protein
VHDGTYSIDFAVHRICLSDGAGTEGSPADYIADHIVSQLETYRKEHLCKILGAGVTSDLANLSPSLCSKLWLELDIVPFVLDPKPLPTAARTSHRLNDVDEIADSMARKCLLCVFSPREFETRWDMG